MKDTMIAKMLKKPINIFHASKSSRLRGNGWQHLVMVVSGRYSPLLVSCGITIQFVIVIYSVFQTPFLNLAFV